MKEGLYHKVIATAEITFGKTVEGLTRLRFLWFLDIL